jgi:hypothetical protein
MVAASYLSHALDAAVPEVSAVNRDPKPYALPFVIRNNSPVFTLQDLRFECRINRLHVVTAGSDQPHAAPLPPSAVARTGFFPAVGPKTEIGYLCPVVTESPIETVSRIDVEESVTYTTLWFWRRSQARHFVWNARAEPPKWTKQE